MDHRGKIYDAGSDLIGRHNKFLGVKQAIIFKSDFQL
jgi:hypothetical protein